MEEQFVDSDQKIVVGCPHCTGQDCIYLIYGSRLKNEWQPMVCSSCEKPYLVFMDIAITCEAEIYKCEPYCGREIEVKDDE